MAQFKLKKSIHPVSFQDASTGLWIRLEGEGLGWEEFVTWEEWNRLVAWANWRQIEQGVGKEEKQSN